MSIEVEQLSKTFAGKFAVQDVSFQVPENTFFCIVGASGCGKSTLLRLIAGLEAPDQGRIRLNGDEVAGAGGMVPPEDRRVGVVFQSYALWPHLSVARNVAFPYEARGLSSAEALNRAGGHLATVALTEFAERRPEALSGGQRQRVALARCLAGDARTILMDEPLANLDPHLRGAMEGELRAFHNRSGVTTLYITHDQREAMALADLMAVMDAGTFLQIGTPQEVYERPQTETVARFIGRGTLLQAERRGGLVRIGDQEVAVDGSADRNGALFVRPNHVEVAADGLPARITAAHYRGGVWEAEADVQGIAEPVMLDLPTPARIGDTLHLRITGGWMLPG